MSLIDVSNGSKIKSNEKCSPRKIFVNLELYKNTVFVSQVIKVKIRDALMPTLANL